MSAKTHSFTLSVVLSTIALAACGSGGGDDGDSPSTIQGTVEFVPATASAFQESEPNNTVDQPQAMGELVPGKNLVLRGTLGTDGDVFDAYSFVARERVHVRARLVLDASPSRRIELAIYDPVSMQVARRAANGRVSFDARGALDLVVRGAEGSGPYSIEVRVAEAAPIVTRAGWLGDVSVGESLALRARGESKWTLTSTEAQSLLVRVPLGVFARIAAEEGAAPTEIVGDGAEHEIACAALSLVSIEASSASAARIDVRSVALPPATRSLARVARLERERTEWNVSATDKLYGRTALEAMPGQILVRARGAGDVSDLLERRSCRVREVITGISTVVESDLSADLDAGDRARTTLALARSLGASARVEFAELNLIRRALGVPATPNDTFFGLQWDFQLIKLPLAWANFAGTNDVVVAVIDTGRRAHPDLDANTIAGYDFISDVTMAADGNGRDSNETDEGDGAGPTPSSFHGTHVAGTIAAVTNNSLGVAGVASFPVGGVSRVRVKHLRVLGKGGGSDSDIAAAIQYASGITVSGVSAAAVEVINLSLGSPGSSQTVQSAINQAHTAGVTVFAAAGNNNSPVAFFPAASQNVVSVSAVDINSVQASYSNFNSTVDLCAPGGDTSVDLDNDTYPDGIVSTLVDEPAHSPIYAFYQGTSMACPHAAGAAAMLLAQNSALSPAQVELALTSTAVDLGATGRDPIYGFGLIDVYQALLTVNGSAPATSPIIAVAPTSLAFGADETVLEVQIFNVGAASLTVGAITDDAPWLTTIPHASSNSSTNIDSIEVRVDRAPGGTPLPVGNYFATITIPAVNAVPPDPSSATVSVTMAVSPVITLPSLEIFVLALNANDFQTVGQAVINPAVSLDYSIPDLPAGEYYLIAGSDDDPPGREGPNDVICGDEDTYCGGYPTLDELEVISISGGTLSGFDFVVAPAATAGAAAGGAHPTFKLLH